ncbi:MAG: hypothetical protein ACRECZ_08475, partial [Methylocella sp.]
ISPWSEMGHFLIVSLSNRPFKAEEIEPPKRIMRKLSKKPARSLRDMIKDKRKCAPRKDMGLHMERLQPKGLNILAEN